MNEPRLTAQAEADLLDVWLYLAKSGEARADVFVEKVLRQCRQLAQFPGMGRDRSNLAANLRSFPVKKYVIFYRPMNDTAEIVRILFGGMDIHAIFQDDAASNEDDDA
jgi:toxin ParE1/3/4